jgi:hypothetical protein
MQRRDAYLYDGGKCWERAGSCRVTNGDCQTLRLGTECG